MTNTVNFEQVVGDWRRKNRLFIAQQDICFQSYINENVLFEHPVDLEGIINELLDLALANCQNKEALLQVIFDQLHDSVLITVKFTGNLEVLPSQIAQNRAKIASFHLEHESPFEKLLIQIFK